MRGIDGGLIARASAVCLVVVLLGCETDGVTPPRTSAAGTAARASGWLGITDRNVEFAPTAQNGGASGGARIDFVLPNSPAERAGLHEGDILLAMDGKSTRTADDFLKVILATAPGSAVSINLLRDGQPMDVPVQLGTRPANIDQLYADAVSARFAAEDKAASEADAAGDRAAAFAHDVTALRMLIGWQNAIPSSGTKYDAVLARLAGRMPNLPSPPTVPSEADRHNRRAIAILQNASSDADNDRATTEFAAAIYEAPWVPDLYLNSGLVFQKAGYPEIARASLQRYLLLAPRAPEREALKQSIAELSVLADERAPWLRFTGTYSFADKHSEAIALRGKNLTMTSVSGSSATSEDRNDRPGDVIAHGTISGRSFQGKWIFRPKKEAELRCFAREYETDARGSFTAEGKLVISIVSSTYSTETCVVSKTQWADVRTLTPLR